VVVVVEPFVVVVEPFVVVVEPFVVVVEPFVVVDRIIVVVGFHNQIEQHHIREVEEKRIVVLNRMIVKHQILDQLEEDFVDQRFVV
jgi:hypothetical protein